VKDLKLSKKFSVTTKKTYSIIKIYFWHLSNICKVQILYFYPMQQNKHQQQLQTAASKEENPVIATTIIQPL
jgi:hypothetical protein